MDATDLPVCDAVSAGTIPLPGAAALPGMVPSTPEPSTAATPVAPSHRHARIGRTTDPRSDVNGTGLRLEKYHLPDGASPRDQLFLTLIKDDADGLEALLTAGADINARHGRGYSIDSEGLVTFADDSQSEKQTLLQWAADLSYSGETIKVLLSKGGATLVNIPTDSGLTPLMAAAKNEFLVAQGFQALVAAGAQVNARDKALLDAITYAASTDNTTHSVLCLTSQKLILLKNAGADINSNGKYTPLMAALYNRNLGVAKLVRGLGGDVKVRAAADGGTALHAVARALNDDIETVKWLLARGIELRVRDNNNQTALQLFQQNLSAGQCHTVDSTRAQINLCAKGTHDIINLIEHRHKR